MRRYIFFEFLYVIENSVITTRRHRKTPALGTRDPGLPGNPESEQTRWRLLCVPQNPFKIDRRSVVIYEKKRRTGKWNMFGSGKLWIILWMNSACSRPAKLKNDSTFVVTTLNGYL